MHTAAAFKISEHEARSALWVKLAKHLEARLDVARRQNDKEIDAVSTARLRGRIAEIKYLLGLDPATQHSGAQAPDPAGGD
jgi:hypothetical protein